MKSYQAIVAEVATGIVHIADRPTEIYRKDQPCEPIGLFDTEEEARSFAKDIVERFNDLEVTVRPAGDIRGGTRFFLKDTLIVGETF